MSQRLIQSAYLIGKCIILSVIILVAFPQLANADPTITKFTIPNVRPGGITAAPDGKLWFTDLDRNEIGWITVAGVVNEFPVPTAQSWPALITMGPDGNFWFTEQLGNNIGRITPTGVITEFVIPTAKSLSVFMTTGLDGNLWFTEFGGNKIGRITPTGVVTEFVIQTTDSHPGYIVAGPDGNIWFTETTGNKIGRITPTGVISEFPLSANNISPFGIAAGPDGNLWFTESWANKIGRITPTGAITEFPVPTARSNPVGIAAGPDGNLWFTEQDGFKIGTITPTGAITEFPVPMGSNPLFITMGSDGNLWFVDNGGKVGRINLVANADQMSATAASDAGQADSTLQSPCIGVQPVAGEKIKPNGGKKWTAPQQVIDVTHIYCAIFTTNNGRMVAELFPKIAPKNVNNFVFLAKNGFYENITWHRVIADFMAQSGDPTGTGTGDPGYNNIPLEVSSDVKYDREGRLAIARAADPNSAGSQFFITLAPESYLDGGYTIIGQVVEGLTVLHQIKIRDVDQNPDLPKGDPLISVRIVDLGPGASGK